MGVMFLFVCSVLYRRMESMVSEGSVDFSSMNEALVAKKERLLAILSEFRAVAVAFSGGIDSTVVAKAAATMLGERAIAVTAHSPSVAQRELEDARRLAAFIGIRHVIVSTSEFSNPDYARNDGSRCYFCKSELYTQIEEHIPQLAQELGEAIVVCSGANLDDQGDYRPGLRAAAEHSVRHPLQEAGFTKADVRALAKAWNLPTWDKPASPCLSSRVAPGVEVTPERVGRVEAAEDYLQGLGLRECRARLHEGELLRIEVPLDAIATLAEPEVRTALVEHCLGLGFRFVTLDLQGFRSGNLNSLIDLEIKSHYTSS